MSWPIGSGVAPRPWTEAEVLELRRLVALGWRDKAIGEVIGRPAMSIKSKCVALHLPRPGRCIPKPDLERYARMKAMAEAGASAPAIAEAFGFKPRSVLGLARKYGWPILDGRIAENRARAGKSKEPPAWRRDLKRAAPIAMPACEAIPDGPRDERHGCQWLLNDARPWVFCGSLPLVYRICPFTGDPIRTPWCSKHGPRVFHRLTELDVSREVPGSLILVAGGTACCAATS